MRVFATLIVVGLASVTGVTTPSAATADVGRTVPCDDAIGLTKFPYLGNSRPEHRYREVLGVVAVPPAYMQQVVPSSEKHWPYWHKQGLVIRATGESVTVTVPKLWRKRAAITWGNSGGPVSSLRIEGCGTSRTVGHAYAGGFLLRLPSACVPLVFAIGKRSVTVRFGIGERCRK
ncbi:MAG TPA: hypothetical protein VGO39_12625 [Gaiellaceae bacterium]|nr:hypothetical protein [Gaiellaceae bacterium]